MQVLLILIIKNSMRWNIFIHHKNSENIRTIQSTRCSNIDVNIYNSNYLNINCYDYGCKNIHVLDSMNTDFITMYAKGKYFD